MHLRKDVTFLHYFLKKIRTNLCADMRSIVASVEGKHIALVEELLPEEYCQKAENG